MAKANSRKADPAIRAIVLDSPLLLEAGLDRRCDVVIFVEARDRDRCRRVQAERGWSPQQWQQRTIQGNSSHRPG